ncbi:MAG: hypothetical protein PSX71_05605 [bacterium]|nr:hypothetical protein [bacterium]
MRQITLALLLVAAAAPACAESGKPLSAIITHESNSVGNDGVTRDSHYQERLVRDAGNVWIERILPRNHRHDTEEKEHKHLDVAEAAQHYRRDPSGSAQLMLVLQEEKVAVHMQEADVEMTGFSKCWPCVYSMTLPDALNDMKITRRDGDLVWYERHGPRNTVRIQWDTKNRIARQLETRASDGSSWSRTTLSLQKIPAVLPWTQYGKFTLKDYSDFGD